MQVILRIIIPRHTESDAISHENWISIPFEANIVNDGICMLERVCKKPISYPFYMYNLIRRLEFVSYPLFHHYSSANL